MREEKIISAGHLAARILAAVIYIKGEAGAENLDFVKSRLRPHDFILPKYVKVADVVFSLSNDGKPVDFEAVFWELINMGEKATIGYTINQFYEALSENKTTLENDVKNLKNFAISLKIEKEIDKARKRLNAGENPQIVKQDLDNINDLILSEAPIIESPLNPAASFDRLKEAFHTSGLLGIPTGWEDVDYLTQGIRAPDFVVIGGRPGMGKTSFMLCIIINALLDGKKILFFSLEMSKLQLNERLLQIIATVPASLFYNSRAIKTHFQKMEAAVKLLENSNLEIRDDVWEIEEAGRIVEMKKKTGLDIVVADYLQLFSSSSRYPNRNEEVGVISRTIKAICLKNSVPFIAGSQLSRPQKGVSVKRPELSDLRESGSIEQDADEVIFIHRPEYYLNPEEVPEELKQLAEIIQAKDRDGPAPIVYKFRWLKDITKFQPYDDLIPDYMDDLPYDEPDELPPPPEDENDDIPF